MPQTILSIDISEETISAVLMAQHWRHSDLLASGVIRRTNGMASLAADLAQLVSDVGGAVSTCVVAAPAQWASYRNVPAPFRNTAKLRQILPLEVGPLLPEPDGEWILDFLVYTLDQRCGVLAAGMQSAPLAALIQALSACQLRPAWITAGCLPLAGLLAESRELPEHFLLIHLTDEHATVYLITAGQICQIRSLPCPDRQLNLLAPAIQRSILGFQELFHQELTFSATFLTGPRAAGLGPAETGSLAAALNVPVHLTPMDRLMQINPTNPGAPAHPTGVLDNALALAGSAARRRTLDFRPPSLSRRLVWRPYRSDLWGVAALLILLVLTAVVNQAWEIRSLKHQIAGVQQQMTAMYRSTFPEATTIVDPLQQMRQQIKILAQKSADAQSAALLPAHRALDVLYDLSRRIHSGLDIALTKLDISPDLVTLMGDADTFKTIDAVKVQLEKGKLVREVTILAANLEKGDQRVRFRLKLQLHPAGVAPAGAS